MKKRELENDKEEQKREESKSRQLAPYENRVCLVDGNSNIY